MKIKKYIITNTRPFSGHCYVSDPLTLEEAVHYYGYTLECGASWQHEKGNKKINRNPKSIRALIKNLNKASDNSARNGCGNIYTHIEAQDIA